MARQSAIGLMSGTSLDGVDVALLDTDGERVSRFGPTGYRLYDDAERACLRKALAEATTLTDRRARPGILQEAEALVTRAHAEAVEAFLFANDIDRANITVVGFHGQTVLHRPKEALTVQIGDGWALAQRLGIPVVCDFRAADVAAGGQGAPIVCSYHRAIVAEIDRPRPVAVLNVGGVANVTYIRGEADPIACDTGPGNALLDDFMQSRLGEDLDRHGRTAAAGVADEAFIARVLEDPFFALAPPKSLDRNAFAQSVDLSAFSAEDGAATLTELTAASVARIVPHLPRPPRTWIVAGGGARNPTLMRALEERLAPARVEAADEVGWSIDSLEAQAFAFLAMRTMRGLPITYPTTTGGSRPMPGGVLLVPDSGAD